MSALPALACFCAAASFFDVTRGRIPNSLNLAGLAAGTLTALGCRGTAGLPESLAGCLAGFSILLVPFALGMVGAGDVKFLAAAGALAGWRLLLPGFLLGTLLGGAAGFVRVLLNDMSLSRTRVRLFLLLGQPGRSASPGGRGRYRPGFRSGLPDPRLPYAAALSAGLLIVAAAHALI